MPKYIRLPTLPRDHATAAKRAGFYLEAVQTLHAWIEVRLRDVLLLHGADNTHRQKSYGRAWDVSNELSYTGAASAAFVTGLVSELLYGRLKRFNRVRNALVHKLLFEPYEKAYPGITESEYTEAFDLGVALGDELEVMVTDAAELRR